jgi:signal transduction histidine kinase/HAMP domain-containing protein
VRLSWGARQAGIFCLLAVILVAISWLLGPISVAKLAVDDATDVSKLITQSLLLQIGHLARETPADPLRAIRTDARIDLILQAATAQAPGVVFVAICDSASTAIAHTNPERVGSRIDPLPALPQTSGFWNSIVLVGHLRTAAKVYEVRTPLLISGKPFASIRVGVAGGLLRERVNEAFRRGLLVAWIQIVLAIAVGFALARMTTQRLRQLEAGVTALREGRFDERIPESGVDEFSRLARDLNLLSEQFQAREHDRNTKLGSVQRTVDLLGEGVLTLGPQMEIVLVNGPTGRILGLDIDQARGKVLAELLPDDHPVRLLVERVMSGETETLSIQLPPRENDKIYAAVAHRIAGGADRSGGVLVEFKEAAELEELHSLVDHSRVLARLGQMAAGVAHEIRNPLQTISLELDELRGAGDLTGEEVNRRVRDVMEEIQRLQRAVSGFLKVARLRQPSFAPLAVNDLLEEIHDSMESTVNLAGLELDLDLASDLPATMGDAEVLRQAVQNLISNGVQALPSRDGRIILASRTTNREILIAVIDTGPGIPPDILAKVCDLYFTTKDGGTGVGLALVRQAVEMHGGDMDIASTVGAGTTVTLRVPRRAVSTAEE